jgi:predicted TIM-barrel fold metal-dependent hydrolase
MLPGNYRPSRRTFLQAAAAGLVLGPVLGARSVGAAEPSLAARSLAGAAVPAGFSIVDAHIHLWDLAEFPVPWIAGNPVLDKSYVLQDYKDQSAGLGIGAIVYVQAAVANEYSLLEADYIADLAAHDPLVQGMVAYAPLEYGDQTRVYLDSLVTRGAIIKGIRRGLPDPADTKFDMERFIQGIQILPEYGLSFDILGKGTAHLDMAIKIAQRAPETSLILDHLLKPDIKLHTLDPWRAQMTRLASFPNVATKISGIATEADLMNWTANDLKPYVDHALSVFGEDRVVFGGDWPPLLTANSTYARWVQTLDDLTSGIGAVGQRKLFGDNARSFYRLPAA